MSADFLTQPILDAAKSAAITQAQGIVAAGRQSFLSTFSGFLSPADVERSATLFDQAMRAKLMQFSATSAKEAQEAGDIYDLVMEDLETIGDEKYVIGKAKVSALVRSFAHQVISGAFAVAGAVLQAALAVVIPGVGSLVGSGANAGLQWAVHHFMGD